MVKEQQSDIIAEKRAIVERLRGNPEYVLVLYTEGRLKGVIPDSDIQYYIEGKDHSTLADVVVAAITRDLLRH